jgi:hypothetical protein
LPQLSRRGGRDGVTLGQRVHGLQHAAQHEGRARPVHEAIERRGRALQRQHGLVEHASQVALGVAEVVVHALQREPKHGPLVAQGAGCEVGQQVRLARPVGADEQRKHRALHRGVLEELRDGGVDVLVADAERGHRHGGRQPVRRALQGPEGRAGLDGGRGGRLGRVKGAVPPRRR